MVKKEKNNIMKMYIYYNELDNTLFITYSSPYSKTKENIFFTTHVPNTTIWRGYYIGVL